MQLRCGTNVYCIFSHLEAITQNVTVISPTATVPTVTVPTVTVEDYCDDGGSTSTFGVGLAVGLAVGVAVGVIFTISFFVVIIIVVGGYIQLYINDGQRTRDFHYRNNIPYSGKFSPGKNFAKARANVLQIKFARFIFAQPGLAEIKFQRNLYLTLRSLHSQHATQKCDVCIAASS